MTTYDLERRPDGENGYPANGNSGNGYGGHAGHSGHAPGHVSTQKSLLLILWRGAWLIVAMGVVCLGAAAFYLHKTTPIYSSTSRILVEKELQVVPGGGTAD